MKKTLKSILAATLAIILAFGSFSAFATEENTLKWVFDREEDYSTEYLYSGEFKEGTNTIVANPENDFLYYILNADKTGYYYFSYNAYDISWIGIPDEVTDGVAYESKIPVYYSYDWSGETTSEYIYYLEAGETVIGIDYYFYETESDKSVLSIEYLGEGMDISFDEKDITDLVINGDIYFYDEYSFLYTDYTLSFTGGKTIVLEDEELYFLYDEYDEGENTITVKLGNFTKDITVTAYYIDHFITDAQLTKSEKYTDVYMNYDYSYILPVISNESIKFTFSDGSTYNSVIDYNYGIVILPNGREYFVEAYYGYGNDYDYSLMIDVANQTVKEYECNVETSGIIDNVGALKDNNNSEISYFLDYMLWEFIDIILASSVGSAFEESRELFFNFFIRLSNLTNDIFVNIMRFLKYYLV